jgi:hypothetical protein
MTEGITKVKVLPLPDLSDILFILVLQIMLFSRPEFLFSDCSIGRHIVCGNFIMTKHLIPHADILSYSFAGKPWIDSEWLADLITASLVHWGGLNLLNVVASSSIAFLILLLYSRCRATGCNFLFVVILTVIGALASSIHWLARPHLFSFFGVYIFSTMLDNFYKGTISGAKLALILSLSMLCWANLHPGFLLGFGILGIYLFSCIVQFLFLESPALKQIALRRVKWLTFATLATFASSLCNPYFIQLYISTFEVLQHRSILYGYNEYLSPIFHADVQTGALALLFAFLTIGLAITRCPLSFPQLVMSLSFACLSLFSVRNMPLFVIVILPLLAQLFSKTIFAEEQDQRGIFSLLDSHIQGALRYLRNLNTKFSENELLCCLHLLPIFTVVFLVLVSLNGGKAFGQEIIDTTFSLEKPTTTLKAIQSLKLNPQTGFNFDSWGGYLNYRLGIPTFIDDRSEYYGESFFITYDTLLNALPGWQELLNKYGIKWVLIPNNSRFGCALQQRLNWKLAAKDDVASLYVETSSNAH